MPSGTLQFSPQVLHQIQGLIKTHHPDKFLEDSSFGSHFKDLQKVRVAIIMNLF